MSSNFLPLQLSLAVRASAAVAYVSSEPVTTELLASTLAGSQPRSERTGVDGMAAVSVAADGQSLPTPDVVVTVSRPDERVSNLVEDGVPNHRLVGEPHDLLAERDGLLTVSAAPEPPNSPTVELEQPVTETMLVHHPARHESCSVCLHVSTLPKTWRYVKHFMKRAVRERIVKPKQ